MALYYSEGIHATIFSFLIILGGTNVSTVGMKSGLEGRLAAGYEAVPVSTGLDESAEHVPLRNFGV